MSLAEYQRLATQYLKITRDHYELATQQRTYWMKLARDYGMTNSQIGEALGISEAAVRSWLRRSEKAAK